MIITVISLLALFACHESPDRPSVIYQPSSPWIWDSPWPSDRYLDEEGIPDMSNFPNPHGVLLLSNYITLGEAQKGWGANSPVHFPLDGIPDLEELPTPRESLEIASPLMIVDVDFFSPHFGERYPVQWHFNRVAGEYQPDNLLSVAPVFGFPLRPETTYAFLITTDVLEQNEDFAALIDPANPAPEFEGLLETLFFQGLAPDQVAIASLITVGNPVEEMARMSRFVRENLNSPEFTHKLEYKKSYSTYKRYRTHYAGPVFTSGERPYLTSGGDFEFTEDGTPIVQFWDDMRLAVCLPHEPAEPPEGGWPTVIYQHGTGGDYDSFCNSSRDLEPANVYAEVGMVGLGIDQPLHGNRNTEDGPASDVAHFNILNPSSGRTNFRQGGLDAVYLAHALHSKQVVFETEDGLQIPIDPNNLHYVGHSHGGLTGGVSMPWLGQDLRTGMLSAAGGAMSITIVERKDILDFAQLVADLLQFAEDEEVHALHPVVGLIQHLVDVTDPVNYAPYNFAETGADNPEPISVLITSGTLDVNTPYQTAVALAAAARMSPLFPRASHGDDALDIRGLTTVHGPLSNNAPSHDGGTVTAAFSQWMEGSHHVVTEITAASDMVQQFLRTAADGEPVIERDESEDYIVE
ncbi:MAG: hypothetical protein HN348_06205 [Proteobacteria bacterium]|nr:hypothetical protein [Pseudomonadota bacterium]